MNSTDSIISFSNRVWVKLNSLSSLCQNNFLNNLYSIILSSESQEKISTIYKHDSVIIINFTYREDLKILTVLLKSERQELIIKIIDLVNSKDIKDYPLKMENNQKFVFENIDIVKEINLIEINSLFSNEYLFKPQDLSLNDDDFWCYFPLEDSLNNSILLSNQQYKIINDENLLPKFIIGNYGTGKTKTAIYSAIKKGNILSKNGQEKILYLGENKFLAKDAKKISNSITLNDHINFYHYLLLIQTIMEKYPLIFTQKFLAQRQITLHKFTEQFFKTKKIFILKAEDLWQEIRYIIKGSIKPIKSNSGLISLPEYLAIKNQSLLPKNTDFESIYNLATQYQEWLKLQNYWDDLDLTRYLLNKLPDNYQGEYESIYIDGIDKFTELQIQFSLKLLKINQEENYLPQIFLVGNNQISFNQNNITWNRVKKILVESYHKLPAWRIIRELIEQTELNYNFNYTDNITNLGVIVANLSGENIHHYSWIKSQDKILVIADISTNFLLSKSNISINSAIVVFDEEERNKLTAMFPEDSERILHFDNINDLEFEEVLIWKMFTKIAMLKEHNSLDHESYDKLKYNYLYSCTNLAKKKLFFYDQNIDEIWSLPNISNLIEWGYETELESLFENKYLEAEISLMTENYLHKGSDKSYQIASQIYHRYDNIIGAAKVEALLEEEQGNWGKAGDIWNKLGIFDEAINCWNEVDKKLWLAKWAVIDSEEWQKKGLYFEKENDYKLAKFCYEKAKDFEGKLRCLERDNQWELAGDECGEKNLVLQRDKYYELADKYYRQHQQISAAIKMWTKLEKWDKVALIWEESQQWEKAGNCWQKQGDVEKAALCWQKAQKWASAQKCWEELGNWQELALSYESEENWDLAAQTWLKMAEIEKAALCYQKANQWHQAEKLWLELGYWGFVAISLQQQNKWQSAACAWSKTNPNELEALCYEQCQEWEKAEKCWLEAKNWARIILACEKQGKWQEAAESWENLGEWHKAGLAWENIGETEKAAFCYEEGECWHLAEKCWRQLQKSDFLAKTLEKQEKWEEAAQIWEKLTLWEKAGNCWHNYGDIEKAALCYEEGKHWRLAEDCWQKLKNWEKVENACKQQGTWQKAAYDWLQANQLEKAALCYENCQDWEKAAKYWEKSQNWEKFAHVCEQLQAWELAASSYLRVNQTEKAAICYEKAEKWSNAEECWRKLWKWEKLAMVCEYQEKWEDAGKAWLLNNEIDKAAICYEKCQDWEKAEECWRKTANWEKLATICEYQKKWEEAAQLWQYLEKWEKAALVCIKMNDFETAVKYYEKGGYLPQAEECRQKISN